MSLHLRRLEPEDIGRIVEAFAAVKWPGKTAAQYERYFQEQRTGQRIILTAWQEKVFCGYLTIVWNPDYVPLRAAGIPEIQDFNILPDKRRQGIGTALMNEAEVLVSQRTRMVGIGVGLYADYGPAQRMYVLRGYVPDGLGITYHNRVVTPGQAVPVDDDLVLHFIKILRED